MSINIKEASSYRGWKETGRGPAVYETMASNVPVRLEPGYNRTCSPLFPKSDCSRPVLKGEYRDDVNLELLIHPLPAP